MPSPGPRLTPTTSAAGGADGPQPLDGWQYACPLGVVRLRAFRPGDEAALCRHADDPEVARWLRDSFPHPYTAQDAVDWVRFASQPAQRSLLWAIAVDTLQGSEVIGSCGLMPGADVFRLSAELGYWLGSAAWGNGIAPAAVRALTDYAHQTLAIVRLYAGVFQGNRRSARVLEKAGYSWEGVRKAAVIKDSAILDEWVYVHLQDPRARTANEDTTG